MYATLSRVSKEAPPSPRHHILCSCCLWVITTLKPFDWGARTLFFHQSFFKKNTLHLMAIQIQVTAKPASMKSMKLNFLTIVEKWGGVISHWMRSWTLNHEVPDSNPLKEAVVPLSIQARNFNIRGFWNSGEGGGGGIFFFNRKFDSRMY